MCRREPFPGSDVVFLVAHEMRRRPPCGGHAPSHPEAPVGDVIFTILPTAVAVTVIFTPGRRPGRFLLDLLGGDCHATVLGTEDVAEGPLPNAIEVDEVGKVDLEV